MAVLPSEAVLMRSFWSDPYLWVHLAGVAAVPLFLELCLLGLAVGTPLFPAWLELLFVGAIGILPILWMQWQRPFSIFSLVLLALKPSQLTEDQRRILQRFKTPLNRILAVLSAVAMVGVLWQLYQIAPAVVPTLFPGINRSVALGVAAIAFLGSNLFLQVPVSVLSVLLTSDSTFAVTPPYAADRIAQDFTIPGIPVARILPPLVRSAPSSPPIPSSPPSAGVTASPAPTPATPSAETPVVPPPLSPLSPLNTEVFKTEQDDEFDDAPTEQPTEQATEQVAIEEIAAIQDPAQAAARTMEPGDNQSRGAEETAGIADEAEEEETEEKTIEAIKEAAQPGTQLNESSEITEEVVIPPPPVPPPLAEVITRSEPPLEAIELEPDPSVDSAPLQESTNVLENRTPNSFNSLSAQPIEIVEDATIIETFSSEQLDISSQNTDNQNADSQNTDRLDTREIEPQQGAEPFDPWE